MFLKFIILKLVFVASLPHRLVASNYNYDGDYGDYGDYLSLFTDAPAERSSTGKVGLLCRLHEDCGPNEICRKMPRFKAMSAGVCDCRRCYGYDNAAGSCVKLTLRNKVCDRSILSQVRPRAASNGRPMVSRRPNVVSPVIIRGSLLEPNASLIPSSNKTTDPSCANTCNALSPNTELLPPNSQCSHDGRLVCARCYQPSSDGRRCVAAPSSASNLAQGQTCRSDCDCSSNLKCRPTCGCPKGKSWNADLDQCVDVQVAFGQDCQTNRDCLAANSLWRYGSEKSAQCLQRYFRLNEDGTAYEPIAEWSTGVDYQTELRLIEMALANNKTLEEIGNYTKKGSCECAERFMPAVSAFVNPETGRLARKEICVNGNSSYVPRSYTCHLDPIGQSDTGAQTLVCDPNELFCYQCPENANKLPLNVGRCRRLLNFTDVQRALNRKQRWNEWDGALCSQMSDCSKRNEICVKPPVEPACQKGFCKCAPGFGYGYDGQCYEIRDLALGQECNGTEDETYPENAYCYENFKISGQGLVVCKNQFKTQGSSCVPDTFRFVGYGSVCMDNCQEGLVCGGLDDDGRPKQTCECPLTMQYWNRTARACFFRGLGTPCVVDAHCDVLNPPNKKNPGGRICSARRGGSRCACDPKFTAAECFSPPLFDWFSDWAYYASAHNDDDYWWRFTERNRDFCENYIATNRSENDYFEIHAGVTITVTPPTRPPPAQRYFETTTKAIIEGRSSANIIIEFSGSILVPTLFSLIFFQNMFF